MGSSSNGGFFHFFKEGETELSANLQLCYSLLQAIYQSMQKFRQLKIRTETEYVLDGLISDFSNRQILGFSLWALSNYIFDCLDKEIFLSSAPQKDNATLRFDEARSLLFIAGHKIPIAERDKITNAHKILKYIFIDNADNLDGEFYYSEIAEDEFGDFDYGKNEMSWRRYYDACLKIEAKIMRHAKSNVNNLLIFSAGIQGRIKINSVYLPVNK